MRRPLLEEQLLEHSLHSQPSASFHEKSSTVDNGKPWKIYRHFQVFADMGLLSFLLEPRLPSMLSANTTTNYLAIVLLIVTFLAHSVVQVFFRGQKPNATPWSPSGHHGMFAALQSALISTLDVRRILTLGGLLPGAQKTGFMISTALDGASVVLPMRNLKWLVAQSEETASFHAIHHERLQLRYTLPVAAFANLSVSRLAARVLTRRSKSTIPDIHEEIETMCTNAPYGHDVQWQPVTLYPEMQRILAATTNRLLVGLPLCTSRRYQYRITTASKN